VANESARIEKERTANLLKRAADAFGNGLGGPRLGIQKVGNASVVTEAPADKGEDSKSAWQDRVVITGSANAADNSTSNSSEVEDEDSEDTPAGSIDSALSALGAKRKQAKKIMKAAGKTKKPLSPEAVENLPLVKWMDGKVDTIIITDTQALKEVQAKLDTPAVSSNSAKTSLFTKLMEARKVKIEADYLTKTIIRRYAAGQNISMEVLFRLPQFRTSRDSADDNIATLQGVISGEVKICDAFQKLVRTGEYGMTVSSRSKSIVKAALDLFNLLRQQYLDSLKIETPVVEEPDDGDAKLALDAIRKIKECKNRTTCSYADMYSLLRNLGQNYTGKSYSYVNHTRVEHGGCKGDQKRPAKVLRKEKAKAKVAKAKAEGKPVDPEDEADQNATETSYAPNATLFANILGGSQSLPDKLRAAVEAMISANLSNDSSNSSNAMQIVKEAPAFSPALAHLIGQVSNTNPDVVMAASQVAVAERSGNKALIEQAKKRQEATEDVDDLEKIYAKKDAHDDVDIDVLSKLDKAYSAFSAAAPMVHATVGVDLDFSWAADNKDVFETAFRSDLAKAVNCSADNITLLGVRPGSTVVDVAFLDLGNKDLSLYLRRLRFTALSDACGFAVSLVFFKEESSTSNDAVKQPFVNGTGSTSDNFSMPVDIVDADKLASDSGIQAAINASKLGNVANDTNATLRLVRNDLTQQFNTPVKSLQVRLLESVRKVVARGNTNNSEAKMELLDKKISEQIAKDRADEEVPNEETVATVKATESKAAAAKKQLLIAEAKLNEVQQDGSGDDMIDSVKTMVAQAKAASAQAEEEVANATKAAESIGVRKLSLSLANMTNMLARNGSFMENIFRRDNAFVMENAKARLMSDLFGDEDTIDATTSRIASSDKPEAKAVLTGVEKVKEELAALDGSSCVGKECALKVENADLQSKIERVSQEQRDFLQANFSRASLSAADGLDALVLANVTAESIKVEECKQSCMKSHCFPTWDMADVGEMVSVQTCIHLSSQCQANCKQKAGESSRATSCESNCHARACPNDSLKIKRDDWKAQTACRATCTSQCAH
jgi:hypothetical protein